MCYRAASSLRKNTRPWLSWIERQTTNLDVGSSNLPGRTNNNMGLAICG